MLLANDTISQKLFIFTNKYMNRIILIGNGFDLAHGLPTSYKDFINWYWNKWIERLKVSYKSIEKDKLCTFEIVKSSGYEYWQNLFLHIRSDLWSLNGYDAIEKISSYYQLCRFNPCSLLRNICQSINTKGWVDIENEYYKILKQIAIHYTSNPDSFSQEAAKLNNELDFLTSKLTEYLTQIQNKYLTEEQSINSEIEKLIFGYINENDISLEAQERTQLNKAEAIIDNLYGWRPNRIMILNFNYTKTAEIQNNRHHFSDITTNYIHGDLSNPANIIFGYGDELDDDFKNILNLNDNNMLKEIKSVRYLETDNYRKLLEFIESDLFQIYIMGHSCGNSDRTLLNTLFEHKNCVTIKPFYHEKEDGTDDYMNIVQNIMRNFNDMKMMRDRVVNKTRCQSLPQMNLQANS